MTRYYLAPQSWDSENYRDVYDENDIANLPDDWDANADDCDYIGVFKTREDAIAAAKRDPNWAYEMR